MSEERTQGRPLLPLARGIQNDDSAWTIQTVPIDYIYPDPFTQTNPTSDDNPANPSSGFAQLLDGECIWSGSKLSRDEDREIETTMRLRISRRTIRDGGRYVSCYSFAITTNGTTFIRQPADFVWYIRENEDERAWAAEAGKRMGYQPDVEDGTRCDQHPSVSQGVPASIGASGPSRLPPGNPVFTPSPSPNEGFMFGFSEIDQAIEDAYASNDPNEPRTGSNPSSSDVSSTGLYIHTQQGGPAVVKIHPNESLILTMFPRRNPGREETRTPTVLSKSTEDIDTGVVHPPERQYDPIDTIGWGSERTPEGSSMDVETGDVTRRAVNSFSSDNRIWAADFQRPRRHHHSDCDKNRRTPKSSNRGRIQHSESPDCTCASCRVI